jgi:chloride channel protein, CIC family
MTKLETLVQGFQARLRRLTHRANGSIFPAALTGAAPLDLRIAGRVVLHAALVGVAAGLMGAAFFASLEYTQRLLLEELAGYVPLRAHGESFASGTHHGPFRPWLLVLFPAIGGLLCGLIVQFAREARGGGGDATIEAFHHRGGVIRRRVIWIKSLASLFSLGTGGAGGREGPTMLIGGALGSLVGRMLNISSRERRILLVAGVAAGMSAVFRTPLGAALLAVEFLYKDGFESDALIPSVLASVVSYSVVISIFGETTLFGNVARFPFVLAHLPLYALLALMVSAFGALFVKALRVSRQIFQRLRVPAWTRPAFGGLALGIFATPVILFVGKHVGVEGQGLGLLGGGYGAVQMAISGSSWLPEGWRGAELLLLLAIAKLFASALTIGSEGSAGDFAPSLAIGGLLGGAFGRTAGLLFQDSRIHPGAFALVGMAVFYGGIAHVPLSALILVCELAGNYDLLVPLMLALGISIVSIRKVSLYDSQVATQTDSPVHRDAVLLDVLQRVRVRDVLPPPRQFRTFQRNTPASEMLATLAEAELQDVFPVVEPSGALVGLVTAGSLRVVAVEHEGTAWLLAADLMQPAVSVTLDKDLRTASARLLANTLREIPVTDSSGQLLALLDEMDIAQWHINASANVSKTPLPISRPHWEIPRKQ